jgi:NADH-quinone oxidoreductase subunit C
MTDVNVLCTQIYDRFGSWIDGTKLAYDEVTVLVKPDHLLDLCTQLRDLPEFDFQILLDVCGLDYLHYGLDDWQTESTTRTGFSRGVTSKLLQAGDTKPNRFAVVYHLLSLNKNHRARLRVNIPDENELMVDSVIDIWPSANWYEREAFDLFGILFKGHPDLRRIMTDYGFIGHPFRKDFPLIGKVEARYDATLKRVVYGPVSISPRTLEPKVIRHDNRYSNYEDASKNGK